MPAPDKRISILGCGWYGLALAKKLAENEYSVKGSTTTPEKLNNLKLHGVAPYLVNFKENEESADREFFDCNVLIISIPPKRSSAEQHTFLSKIERIAKAAENYKVRHIIFISSTSVYGDSNSKISELTPTAPETDSGKAIVASELLLQRNTSFDTTIIRFGGLIGPGRNPGRFFAGKTNIPNGKAPVNLIHLEDCIGITLQIIEKAAFGCIYNACAEDHPDRATFYSAAAVKSGLEKPEFIDELLNWKLIESINVKEKLNYNFKIGINSLVSQ